MRARARAAGSRGKSGGVGHFSFYFCLFPYIEQAALQTVSLALERNRYRLQLRVLGQQVAKLSCLSRSIEQIVAALQSDADVAEVSVAGPGVAAGRELEDGRRNDGETVAGSGSPSMTTNCS